MIDTDDQFSFVSSTRMTAAEYAQLPETMQRVDLIDGVLYTIPTPTSTHQGMIGDLLMVLMQAEKSVGGDVGLSPLDVYFDELNVLQPNLFWVSASNTTCIVREPGYWHGAPDLTVEILWRTTAKRDRTIKFAKYQAYGVREYWIADPLNMILEVFVLRDNRYEQLGVYKHGDTFSSPALGVEINVSLIFPAPNNVL